MKIKVTQAARTQLALIADMLSTQTGFIMGQDIGKFRVIENLFPANFNETTIDEVYAKVYSKFGDKLTGVFFNNTEPFASDWFIGDTVIIIKYAQPEFFLFDADRKYVRLPDAEL
jgi:hypothetical protein